MPRKAKRTISGEAAQPLGAVPGQMYGMGVEQQRMQEALPAPNARIQPAGTPGPVGQQMVNAAERGGAMTDGIQGDIEAGAMQGPSRAEQYQQALAAAQGLTGQAGILTKPTAYPNVPVTNGISVGPGAGSEILAKRSGTPSGRRLRELSQITGDPIFRQLADRARL